MLRVSPFLPITWWVRKITKLAQFIHELPQTLQYSESTQVKIFAKDAVNVQHYSGMLTALDIPNDQLHRNMDEEDRLIAQFMFNQNWNKVIVVDMYDEIG
jgi:hypothetical protein